MKVVWTPEAEQDRAAIFDHLAARDPEAASRIGWSGTLPGGWRISLCSDMRERFPALGSLRRTGAIG